MFPQIVLAARHSANFALKPSNFGLTSRAFVQRGGFCLKASGSQLSGSSSPLQSTPIMIRSEQMSSFCLSSLPAMQLENRTSTNPFRYTRIDVSMKNARMFSTSSVLYEDGPNTTPPNPNPNPPNPNRTSKEDRVRTYLKIILVAALSGFILLDSDRTESTAQALHYIIKILFPHHGNEQTNSRNDDKLRKLEDEIRKERKEKKRIKKQIKKLQETINNTQLKIEEPDKTESGYKNINRDAGNEESGLKSSEIN